MQIPALEESCESSSEGIIVSGVNGGGWSGYQ
jgi:hypothetical protein